MDDYMSSAVALGVVLTSVVIGLVYFKSFAASESASSSQRRDVQDTGISVPDERRAKQGFAMKSVPKDLDFVIIGSGVSGLMTAALQAKDGKRVLVLEQHDQAGGNLHVFEEHGYEFDVGLHYVGASFSKGASANLINHVTDNAIEWEKMDDDFDHVIIRDKEGNLVRRFPVVADIKKLRQNLIDTFPEEEEAILKYFQMAKNVVKFALPITCVLKLLPGRLAKMIYSTLGMFSPTFRLASKTTREVIQSLTKNEELMGVLTYSWGDFGDQPSRGTFLMTALLLDHFKHGAYYPKGGPSRIARSIIRVIEKNGGKVLVRAPVSSIIVENGEAVGVVVKGSKEIRAKAVISTVGAPLTFTKLVPEKHRSLFKKHIECISDPKVAPAISLMSMFVGVKGTAEELKIPKKNLWVFPSYDHDGNCEAYEKDSNAEYPAAFISFSSAKDPLYKDRLPNKQTCLVIVPGYYQHWEKFKDARVKHRGEEYFAMKKSVEERLLKMLLIEYPQLKDRIEYVDVGTPVTNDFYLGNYRGACYGLSHTPERFAAVEYLTPRTPIKNLIMGGQDTVGNGIGGAAASAVLTSAHLSKSFLKVGHKFL